MTRLRSFLVPALASVLAFSCGPSAPPRNQNTALPVPPARHTGWGQESSPWVDSIMASMTLEEKVGQLIVARSSGSYISTDGEEFARLSHLVNERRIGGLAMFQGDVYAEAVLLNKLQRVSRVPLLVAGDFERGITMRVRKGTPFPSAMAIGATRSTRYAYDVARAIGEEARAIGVGQNFAPVADINLNPANPVINTRSFGENKELVADMVGAFVEGTNDANVLSTAKHFPGHGGTSTDSHLDLPLVAFDRTRLDSVELFTFRRAIARGVRSVMVGHLDVPALDSTAGIPVSLSAAAVNGYLRSTLGFDGLVCTDALDMQGLLRGHATGQAAVMAVQAGADIVLMPDDEEVAIDALLSAVRDGRIPRSALDMSVRRILNAKQWLHLDQRRTVDLDRIGDRVGTEAHWKLARDVARDAVTVLKNDGNLLPLPLFGKKHIVTVILSDLDDNRTEIDRPGNPNVNEPAGAYLNLLLHRRYGNIEACTLTPSSNSMAVDSVVARVRKADVLLLALYVKVRSGSGKTGLPDNAASFLTKIEGLQKPTLLLSLGNPYVIGAFWKAQAVICAYGDAEALVEASVEAIFGEIAVRGRLPVSVPPLFAYGSGIESQQVCLRRDDPLSAGFNPERLSMTDEIIEQAIRDSVFPGAQLAIARDDMLVCSKSYGTLTYDVASRQVVQTTLYDLASLTKVFATTPAVMKLYDDGAIGLDDPVVNYLPRFTGGMKDLVTIRHLLLHRSGLPADRKLYGICATPEETLDSIYATPLVAAPGDSTVYSDLGMVLLGKVVEKVSGVPLATFVTREFYDPLRMTNTLFNPPPAIRPSCAPTELDTVWRKRLVQGSVHDETAALLGGISGNAGLFSTANDLATFMQMIMNGGTYDGVRYLKESTVREFTARQSAEAPRALGWDLKAARNSSAGRFFSLASFGHTGFTGTSVWADPVRKLFVILLTNRVYPTRANNALAKIRPEVHDAVMQALETLPAGESGGQGEPGQTYQQRLIH